MKKAALIVPALIVLLAVSCNNQLMEKLMLTKTITLSLEEDSAFYEAKFTGEASTEADVFDCIELVVPEKKYTDYIVNLDTNCLGAYSGKAKKVVIPKEITKIQPKCISDTTVTEIDINSECTDFKNEYGWSDGAFEGCTNLTKVLFNGVEVDFQYLVNPN